MKGIDNASPERCIVPQYLLDYVEKHVALRKQRRVTWYKNKNVYMNYQIYIHNRFLHLNSSNGVENP